MARRRPLIEKCGCGRSFIGTPAGVAPRVKCATCHHAFVTGSLPSFYAAGNAEDSARALRDFAESLCPGVVP